MTQTDAVDFFAFDNSYARLPDRFFARLRAHSRCRAPPRSAEQETRPASRARSGKACRTGGCGDSRGQPGAQWRRSARHGLCGPPVREFRAATRRRTRHSSWRGYRSRWRAPRHPAQGLRPHAVFPEWRRTRRARASPARIHRQRGDGGARDPDDPITRRCDDRRDRSA